MTPALPSKHPTQRPSAPTVHAFAAPMASEGRWWRRLFWPLLIVASTMVIAPLWVGEITPMSDFGGHAQMAHIWTNIDAVPEYAELFARRDGVFAPNVLTARFAALLAPRIDTISAMRLFISLCLMLTIFGQLAVLKAFRRSRWLVFLVLPLLWNNMLNLGLLNYVAAMALMPWGVACGRRVADGVRRGRWVALWMVLGLVAFWTHGVGYLVFVALSGGTLVLSRPGLRGAIGAAALVPSFGLWLRWYLGFHGDGAGGAQRVVARFSPGRSVELLADEVSQIVQADWDYTVFSILGALLIVLWSVQRGVQRGPNGPIDGPIDGPVDGPVGGPVDGPIGGPEHGRPLAAQPSAFAELLDYLRQHTLFVLAAGLAAGFFFILPLSIGDVAIGPRLIAPMMFLVVATPRIGPAIGLGTRRTVKFVIAAGVVLAMVFGVRLTQTMAAFDATETQAMVRLMDQIPPGSRAQCVGVRAPMPLLVRETLRHNCNGLLVTRRSVVADGAFAYTGFNAVRFKDRRDHIRLQASNWFRSDRLRRVDYVIVRGGHPTPPPEVAEPIDVVPERKRLGVGASQWTLYRTLKHPTRQMAYSGQVGGGGGVPLRWDCAPGQALSAVVFGENRDRHVVSSVRPFCQDLRIDAGLLSWWGARVKGASFGASERQRIRTLQCPKGTYIIGFGGFSSAVVDQAGIVCGDPWDGPQQWAGMPWWERIRSPIRTHASMGKEGGEPFLLRCPKGMIAVGIRGREGALLDGLGISCDPVDAVAKPLPLPPSTEPLPPLP